MKVKLSRLNTVRINKAYKDLRSFSQRFVVIYGGAGSAKSYSTSQHVILDCLSNPDVKWCVIRKVARTIKESVFAELCARIYESELNSYFTINKSSYTIECINGSKIIMLGVDNPEKLKSISGITKFWLEEASELTFEDFKQINLRLRGVSKYNKQIFLTFNPVHSQHWLKLYFFDNPKENSAVIHTTYRDNIFLDAEYIQELENLKEVDPYFYDVYCLGKWGSLTGAIFTNWDVIKTLPDEPDEVVYGLDFGFNNPSALVKIAIKDNEYFIQELLYQNKLTNQDLIREIRNLKLKGTIYADAAEPARIAEINAELHSSGIYIRSADKSVKDGIDFVKSQRLHITQDSINLIEELQTYSWKKDKNNNSTDEPVKFKDHALDAMRYAIYTHCKDHIDVPIIRMSGITYPDKNTKSRTPAEAIATMRRQQQLYRHFR